MSLVGDVIVRARNIANDPCQTLGQPVAPTAVASATAGIFSGTIYGFITWLTSWGETTPSSEVGPIAAGTNKAIDLSAMVPPYAAVGARFYFGAASGQEQQYVSFTPGVTATVGRVTDTPLSGAAPYKSSAYLPDTDGDLVSCYEIYRWINDGLTTLGRLAEGILDQTGVAMPAGNAEVVIPGWWLSIKYTWHNGWLVLPEQQSYTWLQSPVQGIPGISTLWRNGAQQVMGTWPQPNTAPAVTALSAAMSATDVNAQLVPTSGSEFTGTDGVMAFNSSTLTSATGGFLPNMAGLTITVQNAGGMGQPLITTIVQVVSPNQLTLGIVANASVSGVAFQISPSSGAPNFTAPGMCQIESEIMSYSQSSDNELTGIVRGYSGTIAVAHPIGAPVSQLIFRLLGRRMPVPVIPGQSANVLDVPQGWVDTFMLYLLSQFKATEQNTAEAKSLMDDFKQAAVLLRDNQIPLESRQVGGLYPLGGAAQTLAEVMDSVIVE